MPVPVGLGEVQALVAQGASLVDVTEADEFARAHLPGAVNIPLGELSGARIRALDPGHPVIVYGSSLYCDRGARAVRVLVKHGFTAVHEYEAGKDDWLAYGLPFAGDGTVLAVHVLEKCLCASEAESCASLRDRMDHRHEDSAVLVDHVDIVLGVVHRAALEGAPGDAPAGSVADHDPLTARPSASATDLLARLDDSGTSAVLVTTSSGRLLGRVSASAVRDLDGPSASSPPRALPMAGVAATG
jgi:rhodanese-related sulfurtransferase